RPRARARRPPPGRGFAWSEPTRASPPACARPPPGRRPAGAAGLICGWPNRVGVSHIVPTIPESPTPPIHLRPAAALAERVLLPGDPQRALAIAQAHLESPRMFNTRRGLWGYTGRTTGGMEVT